MTPVATLYFRVKFYVTDPSRLKEEFTRYQVYMQVKKDISEGRLGAPMSTICLLTSYVVQSTLGNVTRFSTIVEILKILIQNFH